ncbi:MAG: DUF169 domain-containing protein [Planctomycetes bacterium]|nr:DUF169 domain-containing protein [Planctomycetota bacterium]
MGEPRTASPRLFLEALERHVRPATFPLAVRMIPQGEPVPEGARRPQRDLGIQTATCQAIGIARRYGWTLAVGREDIPCPLTRVALGFDPPVPAYTEGHLCEGMYTADLAAGARTEAEVPKFPTGSYGAILIAPLARADFEPSHFVLYANAAQVLLLVCAALHKRGGRLTSSFMGRIDCADILVETVRARAPQVILPCYGDRVYAGTEDHEMAFAGPWSAAAEIAEALPALHRGGVRYPIPTWLRYTPGFPPRYASLAEAQRRGEGT